LEAAPEGTSLLFKHEDADSKEVQEEKMELTDVVESKI